MFKMKCPHCKYEMPDKAMISQYKSYECSNCKASLKVSTSYRIGYLIAMFLGSSIGVLIIDNLIHKNTIFRRLVICPLIAGTSIGIISFLFILLYPNKLSKNDQKSN